MLKLIVGALCACSVGLGFLMVLSSRSDAPLDAGLMPQGLALILGGLVVSGLLFA